MGFLSKIFKPVSKVLDKIVPNEIKPLLPYAAAFAPMFAPGIMGSTMLSRGLMAGGLNLGSQLAQEGSEGDVNMLSALMAGGIGALSAPQVSKTNMASPGDYFRLKSEMAGGEGFANQGLDFLGKGADFIGGGGAGNQAFEGSAVDILGKGGTEAGFNMATAKAAAIPLAQATGDLAYADAQRALRDYENSQGGGSGYEEGDQNRGLAVRRAMERGGHDEQTIQDMLESLGYEDPDPQDLAYGGRVNAMGGGMDYMPTEPSIMGNPAVMEIIEAGDDMRENRIMNSDVEDIADYKGFYEDKKEGIEQILTEEKITEPDFGGIKKAIENVDIKEKGENLEDVGKLIESSDESILRKFLTSKLVQEGRYALSEFLMNDPILFGTPDKFKDGKNNKRSTFKRDSSEYDKLSKEKQAYIEAFLNSEEGQLFLKPGKISFPVNQKMIDHNKNYDEQQTISEYFPDSKVNMKFKNYENRANGGIMNGYNMGGSVLPQGMEMDYRGGGFIPMGSKERADDVPARVSKNEFVMTADAVKAAGGGSVNEGARRMYNLMNNLEARA